MVRCLDCCNLIKSWIPTAKPEWLFDEMWKCKITGKFFEMYYLIEIERQCNQYGKTTAILSENQSGRIRTDS